MLCVNSTMTSNQSMQRTSVNKNTEQAAGRSAARLKDEWSEWDEHFSKSKKQRGVTAVSAGAGGEFRLRSMKSKGSSAFNSLPLSRRYPRGCTVYPTASPLVVFSPAVADLVLVKPMSKSKLENTFFLLGFACIAASLFAQPLHLPDWTEVFASVAGIGCFIVVFTLRRRRKKITSGQPKPSPEEPVDRS